MPEGPSIVLLREDAACFTGQTIESAKRSADSLASLLLLSAVGASTFLLNCLARLYVFTFCYSTATE